MSLATEPNEPSSILQAVEQVSSALHQGDTAAVQQLLAGLIPAQTAHLLESLPPEEREQLWRLVDTQVAGDVLYHMHDEARASLMRQMASEDLLAATEQLDSPHVVELVEELPEAVVEDLLASMNALQRAQVEAHLTFAEGTAGRLMHTDTVTVRSDIPLKVVRRYLRRLDNIPPDTATIMVVDRGNRFQGYLSLLQLLRHPGSVTTEDIMDTHIVSLPPEMPEREVARLFEQNNWISAPVVAADGTLLGRILVDDVVDIIREEGEGTLMKQAGLDEDEDLFAPLLASARRRALWLGINLFTAFLAAWVIGLFEQALDQIVALAVLMPIVASMGGIAGSQTLALTIRGLALDQISRSNVGWLFNKEMGIGLLNGLLWALVVALLAAFWFQNPGLGMVIGAALVINMVTAGIAGIAVPLVLQKMRLDPALSGAVVLTTVTDVIGFMAFLGLATLYLL